MTSFEDQVTQELIGIIRDHMPTLAGFKLTAVGRSDNRPAIMMRMAGVLHQLVVVNLTVSTELYHELPALTRNDVQTPGPKEGG